MHLLDDLQRSSGGSPTASRSEIVARYRQLRATGEKLNSKLVARLSKDVLDEGGRKLGLLRGGTFVFDSEDESAVLMDYCLYDVRRGGRNAIERFLADTPPAAESDEMICLRAMQEARYSLYLVESVEPGLGVAVRDLLSQDSVLVVDLGFSNSAVPGVILAARLLPLEGYWITSGAALPIGVPAAAQRDEVLRKLLALAPAREGRIDDPAPLIRACLGGGSSAHVRYEKPGGGPGVPAPSRGGGRTAVVGRNEPCPCGSGKKFKHCCLKRR